MPSRLRSRFDQTWSPTSVANPLHIGGHSALLAVPRIRRLGQLPPAAAAPIDRRSESTTDHDHRRRIAARRDRRPRVPIPLARQRPNTGSHALLGTRPPTTSIPPSGRRVSCAFSTTASAEMSPLAT